MSGPGKTARDKGAAAEREVRDICREAGFTRAERSPHSGAGYIKGDIDRVPRVSMEVKRQERYQIPEWQRQVLAQAGAGELPVLAFRKSREPWWALTTLRELMGRLASEHRAHALLLEVAGMDGIPADLRRRILNELEGAR